MSKKTEHSFSSVISVNPYKDEYLSGISSFISKTKSAKFSKDQYAISYLNSNDFINAQISISKNIQDEDLDDAINSQVYDELALDQALEYNIKYIEAFNNSDQENRHFHVFVVDPSTLTETFSNVIKKINYIDTVTPVPLLMKSLYVKEIVDSSEAHCYIYFQANDAFITIYNDKEFIYTKSLNFSFSQMHEKFCEIHGERVQYTNFIDFLTTQNLKSTTSNYKESFIKLLKEIFANINDILTYVKRAYEIEKFENIYVGSQLKTEINLAEMCEVELGVKSTDFNFNYGFESDGEYVDQVHALMQVYTTLSEDDRYDCNFTEYQRPPKFMERDSGKLIVYSLGGLALAFLYPATYWALTFAQTIQYDLLSTEYEEIHNIKMTREGIINNKLAEKKKVLTLVNAEKASYREKKNTLIKIHDVKVNYPMKAKILSVLVKDLNKFKVKVESLSYAEDKEFKEFTLNLVSSKDKKITRMLEYLTKTYEGRFNFELRRINLQKSSKRYFGELKVSIL